MSDDAEFVCQTSETFDEIVAAEVAGKIVPWRIDGEGRLWFRRVDVPRILAIPATSEQVAAETLREAGLLFYDDDDLDDIDE